MNQPAPSEANSFAFGRTCRIADFDDCRSVADWQQAIVQTVYQAWLQTPFTRRPVDTLCLNWSSCEFTAPGQRVREIDRPDDVPYDFIAPTQPPALRPVPDVIIALCVLDRHDAPVRFLRQYAQRMAPGGLVVCTFAYWNSDGRDCAIGHEIRKRIYNRELLELLIADVRLELQMFGRFDWRYHGNTLGDHTLAVLSLLRRAE